MQGVQRVLRVLEAVADHQPAGVGEVAKIVGLPKSTVQRHLWALSEAGWIRPTGNEFTRWTLTSRALRVGQRGSREGALREIALEPMRELRDAINETITLQVPITAQEMVQIERVDSEQAVRTFVRLGQVTPPYTTSGGLAYLSALSTDDLDAALKEPLEELTERTVTDPNKIRAELVEIRERGYAINMGRNREGVCAIGAAIRGPGEEPVAAIGVSVPESRFHLDRVPVWAGHLMKAVAAIENRLA